MNYQLPYLRRLLDVGLNDTWIAQHLNIDIQIVSDARQGIYEKEPKQVSVTRPFPVITDDMPDTERILVLTKHGLAVSKIKKYLSEPKSDRAINKYVVKKLGASRKGGVSRENWIRPSFMVYVVEALERLGKDRYTCELCLEHVPQGCVVHHTKYEGATIYDLMYICYSCNLSRENKGLR
ncbi:hypothetical protein AB0280_17700 [Pseudarthrobacter sp902506025]|uniref:hypothetical protein n=1 Tax=Pseudarthrobacter sp. 902506025 TaxID=3155291 RepID=UPI00344C7544